MNIAIIGLWHLGSVMCAGLSSLKKNKVYCFDEKKIVKNFKQKNLPIKEKNIESIIKKNYKKNIFFNSDFSKLKKFKVIWITYDAKIDKNDFSNFDDIFKKIKKILNYVKRDSLIIISTQIPIGSIKTKSASLKGDNLLSIILYGGEPSSVASLGTFITFGPRTPICNHSEAEPGPPLKDIIKGLFSLLLTSVL